jgi:putative transposase
VDDFNSKTQAIEIELNIPTQHIVRVLDKLVAPRRYPLKILMGNWPELISLAIAQWAENHSLTRKFIKPGNALIKRFNSTYRTEMLDFYLFRTSNEAREIKEHWLNE